MTTLVVKLPPALAVRLARVADYLHVEHAAIATMALRTFLRAAEEDVPPPPRKGPRR